MELLLGAFLPYGITVGRLSDAGVLMAEPVGGISIGLMSE